MLPDSPNRLRRGQPVRALIYGRRRRGKSSMSRSLEQDEQIQEHVLIKRHVWNGPRMTSLATAFRELATCLREALAEAGVEAPLLNLSDLTSAEDVTARYLQWVVAACRRATKPLRLLLLLDEFQKWLTGLGSIQERQALLNVARQFNEGMLGKVDVSFVLSGLQNLRRVDPCFNGLCERRRYIRGSRAHG